MIIELHPSFEKSYRKRIASFPKLVAKTAERIMMFEKNPTHPLLHEHALIGKQLRLRAFSVMGDLRIIYIPIANDRALFLDIGTHNQVY